MSECTQLRQQVHDLNLRLVAPSALHAETVAVNTPVDQFVISTPPPESGDHVPVDVDAQEASPHESQMNQQILELLQSMCGRLEALEHCQGTRSPHVEQSIAPSDEAPLSRHCHKECEEGDDLQHDLSENRIVDKKALAHTRCPPLPASASEYRTWKNNIVTMLAKVDQSGEDYLSTWVFEAFGATTEGQLEALRESSSRLPRLDRWLSAELNTPANAKICPELAADFNAYVETCVRAKVAPRGRAMLALVARFFDLDRQRGSLLAASSVFQLELEGFSGAQLESFRQRVMFTLNAVPLADRPSERLLGEWLYHKLKGVRKLERVIEKIRDSESDSPLREFAYLFGELRRVLLEVREDRNAKSVQESLLGWKAATKATAPNTAKRPLPTPQPALAAPPKAPATKQPPQPKRTSTKGMTAQEKAQIQCVFEGLPKGCFAGAKCPFKHSGVAKPKGAAKTEPPKGKPKSDAAKPKGTPKAPAGVPATVALVCGLAAAMSGTAAGARDAFPVEYVSDSGAGRHLCSQEALEKQGVPYSAFSSCVSQAIEPLTFSTGGGAKSGTATLGMQSLGWCGSSNHYMLPQCPFVRSQGLQVSEGNAYVWLPHQLPWFCTDVSQLKISCPEDCKIYASRVSENVPYFSDEIRFIPGAPARVSSGEGCSKSAEEDTLKDLSTHECVCAGEIGAEAPPPVELVEKTEPAAPKELVPDRKATQEPSLLGVACAAGEVANAEAASSADPPQSNADALREEARSASHRVCHYPKNPYCDICNQARLYSKRVKTRRDPEAIDVSHTPPEKFADQLAADHVTVHRRASDSVASGKEYTILVIRDVFSGVVDAVAQARKTVDTVAARLRHFVGRRHLNPEIILKSDAAGEITGAAKELNWLPEPSVPGRWPNNAVLERDLRLFQEITRSVHLASGFALRPALWPVSCSYASVAMSSQLPAPDKSTTRWQCAFGEEFAGKLLALGQLIFYRSKAFGKLSPNAVPGLFAGWILEPGCIYRGFVRILDYSLVHRQEGAWFQPISVHEKEVYVRNEESPVFPLQEAANHALEHFTLPSIGEPPLPLPVPFCEPDTLATKARRVYITENRIREIGQTIGCDGCDGFSRSHNKTCVERFEAAFGRRSGPKGDAGTDTARHEEPLPSIEGELDLPLEFASEGDAETGGPPVVPEDHLSDCSPSIEDHEARSENLDPKALEAFDADLETPAASASLDGASVLFKYGISEGSVLADVGSELGVHVANLHQSACDLEDRGVTEQLISQVHSMPNCSFWASLPCTSFCPWHRPNIRKHGLGYYSRLAQKRKQGMKLLQNILRVATEVIRGGGFVHLELPPRQTSDLKPLQRFICWAGLQVVQFHGCAFGACNHDGELLKRSIRLATSNPRIAKSLAARQCDGTHEHAAMKKDDAQPVERYNHAMCRTIIEALFPHVVCKHVPAMPCASVASQQHRPKEPASLKCPPPIEVLGLVHQLLEPKDWKGRPEVQEVIDEEKNGLLSVNTWCEDEIQAKSDVVAASAGTTVHFGALMIIMSIKGFERNPECWKLKCRIVFRGDAVVDQTGHSAVFEILSASTPSSLAGLNSVIAYSLLKGNKCSTSDAVKAFVQAELTGKTATYLCPVAS